METYKFLFFGHYDFTNKETGAVYSGWSMWFLPSYADPNGYGMRPEKWNISDDEFTALGGKDAFMTLLGKDVHISFRPRGRYLRLAGISEVKK